MAIKLLENVGVVNTGIGASALNNLITGNKSGIVGNYLNECAFTTTGNTIIIDKGLLIICGRQVEIDAIESITLSSLPSEDVRYQIVIELIREESGEVTASIFARQPSALIQENLLKDGFVYQFELGRVTHKTTGQVTEAVRTADILYGQSGAGADIEVGEVSTQMISTELPAEVNINKTVDSGKTKLNFDFSLPKPYEDSVTGLVYSTQIAGNPVNIRNTNDGYVDKVNITNDTASAIESPLTGKSVGKNLVNIANHNVVVIDSYFQDTDYNFVLKPSTVYTLSFNYVVNSTTATSMRVSLGYGATTYYQYDLAGAAREYPNLTSGRIAFTFTTPATFNVAIPKLFAREARTQTRESFNVSISNVQLELGSTSTDFEPYTATAFSIPLKDTSGTVLDLNPADVIDTVDGKYHLNDTELHDDSQDALRSIPTVKGETNLIGDQPFTFDITELAMGIGEKKYALLTDGDGNAVMPVNEADNTLMFDGRTVEQGLQKLREDIDNLNLIPYDIVIRTQAEFEALIASPTWFDAQSVALVGQFVYDEPDNNGIMIPQTVKQIHGFNSAKITVTNFVFNSSTAKGGLWYDTLPTTNDYSIRDLEVDCTGPRGHAFRNCTNLTNCTGTGTATSQNYGFAYGFYKCTNLTNCTGTGTGSGTAPQGYGFFDITTASNCKDGGSSTNMWGGINKNINLETCRKTLVNADNATLNT